MAEGASGGARKQKLVYTLVARGTTVLSEASGSATNAANVARKVLLHVAAPAGGEESRSSYSQVGESEKGAGRGKKAQQQAGRRL